MENIISPNGQFNFSLLEENFSKANKIFEEMYKLIPMYFPNIDFERLKLLKSYYDAPLYNQSYNTFNVGDVSIMSSAIRKIVSLLRSYSSVR